ncbi:MAG: aldehyde ferredoxin oxidoreductase family protein [Chloroflexota bacterium]
MFAYNGRVLHVDLTTHTSYVREVDADFLSRHLGGAGLATRLVYDNTPAGADPYDPASALVLASSAFAATMVPTSGKHVVAAKSPLTGFIGDSLSSSFFSVALKRAGYDAIVITGAVDSLSYLLIRDDLVQIRDAQQLAGLEAPTTERWIRRQLRDDAVRVAAIGPAGEKLVRYACLGNDESRQAGRTGIGAVMGAKRLKAIAVRGTRRVEVADLPELERICLRLYKRAQESGTEKYRILGTPSNVLAFNRLAILPTRNFQQSTFDGAETVSGEYLREHFLVRTAACATCPIGCEHTYQIKDGPYAGVAVQLDYETLFALGPLCGIDYFPAVARAAQLCDLLGMDSISAGVSVAWAMECFERGLLTRADADGLELRFGNHEALLEILPKIARREGLGALLAEGVKRASAQLGQGSDYWAMHAKGLEFPGYEPRALKTLALGFATGTRGACHNRSAAYEADVSGKVDRFKGEPGRGQLAAQSEDFAAVLDSLILCKFIRRCFDDFYPDVTRLYTAATGIATSPDQLRLAGERVTNLKKAFNIREGWTRQDDWLPPRVFRDPLPTGVAEGVRLGEDELELMIDDYYQARGWTPEGLIPDEKLRELGLEDLRPPMPMVTASAAGRGKRQQSAIVRER